MDGPTHFSPSAFDDSKQVNFAGDNFGPLYFGSGPVRPPLRQLPASLLDFMGRKDSQDRIDSLLRDRTSLILNVFGKPGVGKSAFAAHVANRLAADFEGDQIY